MKIFLLKTFTILTISMFLYACQPQNKVTNRDKNNEKTTIFLIGDSTMADYSGDYDPGKDYMKVRYPMTGWGQVFGEFFVKDSLNEVQSYLKNTVEISDRAHGGRSTRTFFQEGRWRYVYENLWPNDYVLMQFGHNDSSEKKPERYVDIEGYKEFLRLFVSQTLQKGGKPIILTPVARNYPWKEGKLENVHGEYWQAAIDVAKEMNIPLIDLNQLSMDYFTLKGKDFVSQKYFMNISAATYEAYPKGLEDDTHFQPDGAKAVAQLVFDKFKSILLKEHLMKK